AGLLISSSRMMSLHKSTHSSQMNTDGPAMSLRTSCSLLPQKEQYSVRCALPLLPLFSSAMVRPRQYRYVDHIRPAQPAKSSGLAATPAVQPRDCTNFTCARLSIEPPANFAQWRCMQRP